MQKAAKISITMTPDMLRTIRESVEAGEYASTSEVLRDAVRVWRRQRIEDAERLTAIRTRVRRSLDDPRPSIPLDEAFDRIEKLHADTVKARGDASASGQVQREAAEFPPIGAAIAPEVPRAYSPLNQL